MICCIYIFVYVFVFYIFTKALQQRVDFSYTEMQLKKIETYKNNKVDILSKYSIYLNKKLNLNNMKEIEKDINSKEFIKNNQINYRKYKKEIKLLFNEYTFLLPREDINFLEKVILLDRWVKNISFHLDAIKNIDIFFKYKFFYLFLYLILILSVISNISNMKVFRFIFYISILGISLLPYFLFKNVFWNILVVFSILYTLKQTRVLKSEFLSFLLIFAITFLYLYSIYLNPNRSYYEFERNDLIYVLSILVIMILSYVYIYSKKFLTPNIYKE